MLKNKWILVNALFFYKKGTKMAKTKGDVKNEIKEAVAGCRNFEQMVDAIAAYVVRNYKLKKVTLTTTLKTEEIKDE